jgi:hypothetical protein
MSGFTLDSGALIGFERNARAPVALIVRARRQGVSLIVPAGVLAQVWRDGGRQARLANLLSSDNVRVEPLDESRAREAGALCGLRGTSDIVDASVVICAIEHGHAVITSDPHDLARLAPKLKLIAI